MKNCKRGHAVPNGVSRCPQCHLEAAATYRARHSDRIRESDSNWRAKNKESIRIRNAAYRAANRDRILAQKAQYRSENPEKVAKSKAEWYGKNRVRASETHQAWLLLHPEYLRDVKHRRRARKMGNPGTQRISPQHLKSLLAGQNGCCYYCHVPLESNKHLDHRVPLARGGAHAPDNVCWACPSCNLRKHTKTETEFLGGM